ncbi:protein-methionine-sulfoxide reductase catalytic subunit MsrP [Uliginosibacterium sp. H1]|uniref:protein-methionine-sulfoxide reductase catalytic subunit MsrP n=1 Tax=Uliginosibacterium sp. H1 TaxID=3114757 RepID=UPI002E185E02|nr:protein-methionine-sulfoxide reductase catalytic subunit MsrP [Uliginosibacterium sp. H1]
MLIRRRPDIQPSEITPREVYRQRRDLMRAGLAGAAWLAAPAAFSAKLATVPGPYKLDESPTRLKDVTSYNNYYEFGTGKYDPEENAKALKTRPWSVAVEGLCAKPKVFGIEELLKLAPLEERTYRMRCVEGWSMVIPWVGFPISALLKQVQPLGSAKYVEFVTLEDPKVMPGLRVPVLDWPYVEGLRLDEANHPLSILAVGLYGEELLPQNGAPIRLVVPWKYGFKSAKSIVKIRLVEQMPKTAWNVAAPQEYGFYSNVNPNVDHPRWSQATERRIGELTKRKTLMFNGYANEVASLYTGMDLKKLY